MAFLFATIMSYGVPTYIGMILLTFICFVIGCQLTLQRNQQAFGIQCRLQHLHSEEVVRGHGNDIYHHLNQVPYAI